MRAGLDLQGWTSGMFIRIVSGICGRPCRFPQRRPPIGVEALLSFGRRKPSLRCVKPSKGLLLFKLIPLPLDHFSDPCKKPFRCFGGFYPKGNFKRFPMPVRKALFVPFVSKKTSSRPSGCSASEGPGKIRDGRCRGFLCRRGFFFSQPFPGSPLQGLALPSRRQSPGQGRCHRR